ncbi:MAG: ricin-type beta-trefoil lectin domain protein [Pseudomonadota bacterium]
MLRLAWGAVLCLLMSWSVPSQAAGSKDYKNYRLWQKDTDACLTVPGGDMRAGVALRTTRCNSQDASQYFVWQDDGHWVANNGNANARGERLCVDSDGRTVMLQVCRRLTTGDRQWWRRDVWGFIQNARGLECMGLGRDRTQVVIGGCSEPLFGSWSWVPFTLQDIQTQAIELSRVQGYPNTPVTYDPEVRSRWEDNVRQYGSYVVMKDTRTGYCIQPHPTLSALIAGGCGTGVQRFHLNSAGLLREVRMEGKYRGVSGLCVSAPMAKGGYIALQPCDSRKPEQRWWIVNGQVQTQSQAAGNRCLDVANESREKGAYLIAWTCSSSRPANQTFGISYETQFKS